MAGIDLKNLTIEKAHEAMKAGEFSSVELTQAYLDTIREKNDELNVYLEVFEKSALEEAKKAVKRFADKEETLLTGIPLAVKDNILIKGKKATAASKILENYEATYNATAIEQLKKEGVVFLGRTNLDEFAMGASTENSAFGPTKNPHDTKRVPGGSSGGSAAAVAADMCLAALGSDTAGSIRQPASFCGVVGLKPTYGAVSRHGLIALGSSLDCIGPITKTARGAEIIHNAIKGKDSKDSTTLSEDAYKPKKEKGVIGIPDLESLKEGVSRDVFKFCKDAENRLKEMGYKTQSVSLPNLQYAVPTYYIILPAEASANLARYDGVKYGLKKEGDDLIDDYFKTRAAGFGPEVRRRILIGTYVLSAGYMDAYYNKAQEVRQLIGADFEKAFKEVDAVLTPTTAGPAFRIGEKINDPVKMYLEDMFTVPANHAGLPAISFPANKSEDGSFDGLPMGVQFIAPHQREDLLFKIGKQLEQ